MTESRVPAEGFTTWEYVSDEMAARGWDQWDLAAAMGGDVTLNYATLDFLSIQHAEPRLLLGRETAEQLAKAFGTSAELWLNLDESYRQWREQRDRLQSN